MKRFWKIVGILIALVFNLVKELVLRVLRFYKRWRLQIKIEKCIVKALVDSYYYHNYIYILKSGKDFVYVHHNSLKRAKQNVPGSFNGKGLKDIINSSIATIARGSIIHTHSSLHIDNGELELKASKFLYKQKKWK